MTIYEMYMDGLSLSEIERQTGKSRYLIKKELNGVYGTVEPKPKECPNPSILKALVDGGHSIKAIAKYFDTYQGQVQKWLVRYELKTAPNKFMPKTRPTKDNLQSLLLSEKTLEIICKELDCSYPTLMKWIDECGLTDRQRTVKNMTKSVMNTKLDQYGYAHFPDSVYLRTESKAESDLRDYLNSIGGNFHKTNIVLKTGERRELDMYDPTRQLAIEYCGAYWHSEIAGKTRYYHYEKYEYCRDNGIKLLTIWDLEYQKRQDQILAFIRANMGIFETRLNARSMEFRELGIKQHDFFEVNHIQGRTGIDRNFGLVYDNEIMGCVSYAKHHRDSSKYTLNRLAFKRDVQIIGGVGKLLKNSLKLMDREIITWSDNRFSNGRIYEQNGFIFDKELEPDYSYFDSKKVELVSKQSQRKSLTGCPPDVTEREFCFENGLYRLWDCGKRRFIWNKD